MSGEPSARVLAAGAALALLSGYVHFYLYFRGGYRGIHPRSFAGVTVARAFLVNAVAGLALAELLVLAIRRRELTLVATLGAVGFAVATLIAYALSRTVGLLGFTEDATTTEAVIASVAELGLIALLVPGILRAQRMVGSQSGRRVSKDVISAS